MVVDGGIEKCVHVFKDGVMDFSSWLNWLCHDSLTRKLA
jgi:hypothetical protein